VNEFSKTHIFECWFEALKDRQAKRIIRRRIDYAENGNFGDCEPVGEGVSEMRIHFGSGYRLYYFQSGKDLYWILAGGDKNRQQSDVELAKVLKRRIQKGEKC
jgi:putative addiction module killer protein